MTTQTETYNGWKNYETWAVALHLDNDEGTYNAVRETASAINMHIAVDTNVIEGIWSADDAKRFRLADWLKDYAETLCGIGDESDDFGIAEPSFLAMDMIRAALSEVDWDEIARHIIAE